MSTEIYDAYIFKGELKEVFQFKKELQKLYGEDVKNALTVIKDMGIKKFGEFREANKANEPVQEFKDKTVATIPYYELAAILEGVVQRGNVEFFNFSADMMLYCHEDKIIVQFFGFVPNLFEKYFALQKSSMLIFSYIEKGKLVDFHYQNQCDQPEGASDEEWEEREKIWDEIVGDDKFCEAGFGLDFAKSLLSICYDFKESLKDKSNEDSNEQ